MRCECLRCKENEDGYCSASSYVTIQSDGTCDMKFIPSYYEPDDLDEEDEDDG